MFTLRHIKNEEVSLYHVVGPAWTATSRASVSAASPNY